MGRFCSITKRKEGKEMATLISPKMSSTSMEEGIKGINSLVERYQEERVDGPFGLILEKAINDCKTMMETYKVFKERSVIESFNNALSAVRMYQASYYQLAGASYENGFNIGLFDATLMVAAKINDDLKSWINMGIGH